MGTIITISTLIIYCYLTRNKIDKSKLLKVLKDSFLAGADYGYDSGANYDSPTSEEDYEKFKEWIIEYTKDIKKNK